VSLSVENSLEDEHDYGYYRDSGWTFRRRSDSCASEEHEQIKGVKGYQAGHWLASGSCQVGLHPNTQLNRQLALVAKLMRQGGGVRTQPESLTPNVEGQVFNRAVADASDCSPREQKVGRRFAAGLKSLCENLDL
jgi:hypothetical protein